MQEPTPLKACSRCQASKPTSEFGINRATPDGLQYHCKVCFQQKRDQRTPEQVEARRRYNAEYMTKRRSDPAQRKILAERHRIWAAKNPERVRQLAREYRSEHPEKFATYRENDREGQRARSRAWAKAHPEANREKAQRRRALIRGVTTGPVDLDALWTGLCAICGAGLERGLRHPDPMSPSIDHIVALSRGGTHTQDNLQWTHRVCNLRKYVNPQ